MASGGCIIFCGDLSPGSTSAMRLNALRELGYQALAVSMHAPPAGPLSSVARRLASRMGRPLDVTGANRRLVSLSASEPAALVWIEKGLAIRAQTIRALRARNGSLRVIGYSPDDMSCSSFNSRTFLEALPEYDAFITTKSFGVGELTGLGARRVVFSANGFDPSVHRPMPPRQDFSADVCFVGTFEARRARSILALAKSGVPVSVVGNGWGAMSRRPHPMLRFLPAAEGDSYARTLCSCKIALGFLRELARDLQTTRSIEIPACGVFMLAERTKEHEELFEEGIEAEYFSDDRELVAKCRRYLSDDEGRANVARAGFARTRLGRYSYAWRLHEALQSLGIAPPRRPEECVSAPAGAGTN